ncbi:MAG: hypothetical protein INR69_14625 [Mucilaginibacter polytrichastri]|nr:hypothetical protein [Mucilaginibacter polytrichastri]
MFNTLIFLHSLFRWLVLFSLLYAILRAWTGLESERKFTRSDNALRHWTVTIAHIQLILGMALYTQSETVKRFFAHVSAHERITDPVFFGVIHISLMLLAIVLITIGSAKAKRKNVDSDKFRTMLLWFSIALLIIFIAIPWPFSPLATRPYLHT